MSKIQLEKVNDPHHLESQVQLWNKEFASILDEVAPLRKYPRTGGKHNWVDKDTRGLMRLRNSMLRKVRAGTLSTGDWEMLHNLKRSIKSRIRASIKNHGQLVISKDDPKETNLEVYQENDIYTIKRKKFSA